MKATLYICLLLSPLWLWSQSTNRSIRQGVKAFQQGQFTEAQAYFEEAVASDPTQFTPIFNQGDAWYEMDSVSRAAEAFQTAIAKAGEKSTKAQAFHNLGNTYLKAQQYEQSVQAFQQALIHNPNDEESRYNLAYAMTKLQEQQQNQDQNQEQQKDQDKEQQDQQKENKQNQQKSSDKKEEQQEQQQSESQEQQDQNQQQQPQQQEISQQQAEQILQALENEEQKIQQKFNKKAAGKTTKKEKDW